LFEATTGSMEEGTTMDADQFVAMVKENIDDTPTEEDVRA